MCVDEMLKGVCLLATRSHNDTTHARPGGQSLSLSLQRHRRLSKLHPIGWVATVQQRCPNLCALFVRWVQGMLGPAPRFRVLLHELRATPSFIPRRPRVLNGPRLFDRNGIFATTVPTICICTCRTRCAGRNRTIGHPCRTKARVSNGVGGLILR